MEQVRYIGKFLYLSGLVSNVAVGSPPSNGAFCRQGSLNTPPFSRIPPTSIPLLLMLLRLLLWQDSISILWLIPLLLPLTVVDSAVVPLPTPLPLLKVSRQLKLNNKSDFDFTVAVCGGDRPLLLRLPLLSCWLPLIPSAFWAAALLLFSTALPFARFSALTTVSASSCS